jgi:hypothetical protein
MHVYTPYVTQVQPLLQQGGYICIPLGCSSLPFCDPGQHQHHLITRLMCCAVQGLNPGKAIAKIKQSLHKGSPT